MAVAIAIMAWAFTTPKVNAPQPLVESWFVFNGGDPEDPSNYTITTGTPNCPGNQVLCAVYAEKQPEADLPTEAALIAAAEESDDFTMEVTGLVERRTAP